MNKSTKYIDVADIEEYEFLASILRRDQKFKGLKIALEWKSFGQYLDYRLLSNNFADWDDFYKNGKISVVTLYCLGVANQRLASEVDILNKSSYLEEAKMRLKLEIIPLENGLVKWVEL
jgi:hypothetical protein